MKTVVWSESSVQSIQSIYDFIHVRSPKNAEFVIDTLFDIGDNLNKFTERNPKDLIFYLNEIRFFPKWNFKIVYRFEKNDI
ncbi:MAG: type II toxin-antitoxin system RelE/ParE family toxin [Flavobacteriaceae bacterium]|nr:type II toxin-antitoxin system RelE/ParE family toxin [Flavobacteriaceae bacterium]MDZ4148060.1 type II toxin-antitoxin system RelE/ParE family toxin [Flavobacteriaceae bacterium]